MDRSDNNRPGHARLMPLRSTDGCCAIGRDKCGGDARRHRGGDELRQRPSHNHWDARSTCQVASRQQYQHPGDEPLAWKGCGSSREWGDLTANENGDADAFGCDERTPSLPYAAKEYPRVEKNRPFHAWAITGLLNNRPGRSPGC